MQTALITGANRGIGLEVARQLGRKGYFVWLGSRDIQKGEAAAALLRKENIQAAAIQLDANDTVSVQQCSDMLSAEPGMLDVLINNAGIRGPVPQQPSTVDISEIKKVFDTNFFGVIAVTQALLPLLKRSTAPRIVNVTSDLASLTLHNDPAWRYYAVKGGAYGPSKTALNAYTVALAYEFKDTAFKINCVNPGYTATEFNQYQGTKKVEDAARVIVNYAVLDNDGPTGRFFSEEGEKAW